jgi:OmpA-OmpF porin, OOP family
MKRIKYGSGFTYIITFLFSFLISVSLTAQKVKLLSEADRAFENAEYHTAAHLYKQLINGAEQIQQSDGLVIYRNTGQKNRGKINQYSRDVVKKMADSYRLSYQYQEAINYYNEYLKIDPVKNYEVYYWIAVCKRSIGNFSEALISLENFFKYALPESEMLRNAEAEKQTIIFAQEQYKRKDTSLYRVKRADSTKSPGGSFAINLFPRNGYIISSAKNSSNNSANPSPYINRLFIAKEINNGFIPDTLVQIENLDYSMNQSAGVLNKEGTVLYFTQSKNINGILDSKIYYSKLIADKWTSPILLPNINTEVSNQKHPSISGDGKILYFSSDRSGGIGGFDIWYSFLDANGIPGVPNHTGSVINTPQDEITPFYHSGSGTLVFSNNSRKGLGGYDCFFSKGSLAQWEEPSNAGYPVNSPRDDMYFISEGNKLLQNAFLSSDRGSDCCLEIYHVAKKPKKILAKGILSDCKTGGAVLDAEIHVSDKQVILTRNDGSYSFEVNEDDLSSISFKIKKSEYQFKTVTPLFVTDDSDALVTNIQFDRLCIEPEEKIIEPVEPPVVKREEVSYVNFDFNKSNLLKLNLPVLDSFVNVLKSNPNFTVKIDAHTDSKGSDDYNLKLSTRRATTVANYFKSKGIEDSRIIFEGFGKCCPLEPEIINGVYSEDAARRNRRALIHISRQ